MYKSIGQITTRMQNCQLN